MFIKKENSSVKNVTDCSLFDSHLKRHEKNCDGSKKITQKPKVGQKMKDVEYSVFANDNLGKMYQCKRCEKSFNSLHMISRST